MALFESAIVQTVSSIGTQPTRIWDNSNTSGTMGSLGSVSSTAVISGLQIVNTGTANIYVGSGTVAYASTTGLLIEAGKSLVMPSYSGTGGSGAPGVVWANTGTVGWTSSTIAGMPTVVSVV